MDIHGTPGSESGVTLLRSEDCLGRVNMLDSSIRDWVRPGVRVVSTTVSKRRTSSK